MQDTIHIILFSNGDFSCFRVMPGSAGGDSLLVVLGKPCAWIKPGAPTCNTCTSAPSAISLNPEIGGLGGVVAGSPKVVRDQTKVGCTQGKISTVLLLWPQ